MFDWKAGHKKGGTPYIPSQAPPSALPEMHRATPNEAWLQEAFPGNSKFGGFEMETRPKSRNFNVCSKSSLLYPASGFL